MRKIGKQEIEDISIGAALLGTGGGGDPYIGKLMTLQAIEEFGPITLLDASEVPDDAIIVPTAMMGAPTVMVEKIPSGEEAITAFESLKDFLGKDIYATMPIEAGGVNSLLPFALAAKQGLPVIDADGMGRAFPELQMVTFYLEGLSATPMMLTDEKGNALLLNTIDSVWAERLARGATIEMGGSVMLAIYPMTGAQLKKSSIQGILSLEQEIGRAIREAKEKQYDAIDAVLELTNGQRLFQGKVTDIDRKTETGFARGIAKIEGIGADQGDTLELFFQNEHLLAKKGGKVVCMTPDLIAVLDADTGMPITTEGMRYGTRCVIVGMPCHPMWRSEKGVATAGPRYFGYEFDYVPLEQLTKKEVTSQ